jgi:hypothetical protein
MTRDSADLPSIGADACRPNDKQHDDPPADNQVAQRAEAVVDTPIRIRKVFVDDADEPRTVAPR